jgi:hypothetical protein
MLEPLTESHHDEHSRRWFSYAVAAGVAVLLAGAIAIVGDGDQPTPLPVAPASTVPGQPTVTASTQAAEAGPRVWVHTATSDGGGRELFAVGGVLGHDTSSGCFMLKRNDVYGVIWPTGTRLLDDGIGVVLPDGTAVRPGDGVKGDGTFETGDLEGAFDIPGACRSADGAVISFNAGATMEVIHYREGPGASG